ncbi:MAG: cysteine hydrolase [Anaerolineae bacterium]|nr:cysteine hydrolase [Anaerolineae bacterium]
MTPLTDNTALILIDVQDGLDDPRLGQRSNPDAERNMARLLAAWRERGRPIFHIQHMSTEPQSTLRPELPGNAIKRIVAPQGDEPVLQKTTSSAFISTDLKDRLRARDIQAVVLVGLTTEHCVSATARMAGDYGFNTVVVADATACHGYTGYDGAYYPPEAIHAHALVSLQDESATILTTQQVLDLLP